MQTTFSQVRRVQEHTTQRLGARQGSGGRGSAGCGRSTSFASDAGRDASCWAGPMRAATLL
jgi:hypothetical protein